MTRTLQDIDADLATTDDPAEHDRLLDERLQAAGPLRPSQVLATGRA